MIKGCIFDLDGTLADTVESIAKAVNTALKAAGFSPRPVKEFNFYAGDGMDMSVERALLAAGDRSLSHLQESIVKSRAAFALDPLHHVKPYGGMVQALEIMKERGIRLAVLSNKPHLQAIDVVESLFGKDCFDVIQGQEAGVPKKPDPSGALKIADLWQVAPEECMYVGDTDTDMKTAVAAGMYCVGVAWGFRPKKELLEHGAQVIAQYPLELPEILRGCS